MNPCVIIPVYNHAATLMDVVRSARRHAPVIVIDDGSTDGARALLESEPGITAIFEPVNRGKGRALKTGFDRARKNGYTHAITVDADGQHDTDQIPDFLSAISSKPEAIFVGSRDLAAAGAPGGRRFANSFSNFWHWVETGRHLPDTQSGFRAYPLGPISLLVPTTEGYGFELEILVHAAWLGIETRALPIRVVYEDSGAQRSHFRPGADFARISVLNARLTFQALALPPALRRAIADLRPTNERLVARINHRIYAFLERNDATPAQAAMAIALGCFVGLLPLWSIHRTILRTISKTASFSLNLLEAGFDVTRPMAGLLPLAFAWLAPRAHALDFFMPDAHIMLQGIVAWLAACGATALAAGGVVYVMALKRITGRPSS